MNGIEALIQLGLTPQEARLYVALDDTPRPALEIAAETGLARSRVYQVLGALASRGLVERDGAAYRALDLSTFLLKRQTDLLRELKRLEDLDRAPLEEPLSARVVSEAELLPLAARALASSDGLALLRASAPHPYAGLPVAAWSMGNWRIITDDASWIPEAARTARPQAIRVAGVVGPSFGSSDGSVHVLSGEKSGLLVQSPALALQFRATFEVAWAKAKPL